MRATAPVHRAMRVVSEFSARGLARGLVFNPGDAKSDDPHHWRLDPQLVQQLSFHPKRETPIANNGTPGTNTATLDGGEVTRPLVLLLGWWGASPGNLKHYRDLYADLGYDTLVHLPPMRHTFLPRSTVRKNWRMLEALDVFRKSRQGPLRIVVHAMSNNGAYNAACLGALMRLRSSPPPGLAPEKEFLYTGRATEIALDRILPSGNGSPPPDLAALRDCIAGIIVDSAPSALTPRVIAKAAAIVFTGAPDITPSVRRFGIAGSTWWDLFERFFAFWMRRPSVVAGMDGLLFPALDRLPSLFPRAEFLMLYGKGDKLVPAESVVEYRDHLRGLGARARALEFEGSGHVAHYRGKNRFAYAKAVGEFLQRCAGHGAEGGAADGAGARRSVVGTDVRGG
ncbi:hypothetical protein DFJ74DRAFT_768725 [Hyaloraphidium curvatum]|nr:hypothetical protein DFJ74DRAFT_768725 [Hyaloraphidium curvatum]